MSAGRHRPAPAPSSPPLDSAGDAKVYPGHILPLSSESAHPSPLPALALSPSRLVTPPGPPRAPAPRPPPFQVCQAYDQSVAKDDKTNVRGALGFLRSVQKIDKGVSTGWDIVLVGLHAVRRPCRRRPSTFSPHPG